MSLCLKVMKSPNLDDYRAYYQETSDVCMLRLFESFLESAPQLVFHLFVLLTRINTTDPTIVSLTGISAVASMVSLGWGIVSYNYAQRMCRQDKMNLSWMAMVLQTIWRFGMLSGRILALVLLTYTLKEWVIIVMCK